MNVTISDLFEAGVHLGHQRRRWNPKSKAFVYAHRSGISIIDLEKTHKRLELACEFLEELVAGGQNVMFVATKKQAQDIIRNAAGSLQMPFCVNHWLGGGLTNFDTVKKSLNKYRRFLEMEADGTMDSMLKKEASVIRRQMMRMRRNFEGLTGINELPSALFVVDVKTERIAVAEAKKIGIPVVAIVDTNSDPTVVTYPIPGNDDSSKSIKIIIDCVSEAIAIGKERYSAKKQEIKKNRKIIEKDELIPEQSVVMDEQLTKAAESVTLADEMKSVDKAMGKTRTQISRKIQKSPKEKNEAVLTKGDEPCDAESISKDPKEDQENG
ncbi:MAG: 30S ribosomal protein S2 [Puniceicoccales bacterium]|jgi:small subunit ribosomal protein S2|nr:30S ribosomal protein S2 [Puniceicoccales bacterium]